MTEWGLEVDKYIADTIYDVFYAARKPLHWQKICNLVQERKRCKAQSVYYYLNADKRFVRINKGIYGLAKSQQEGKADLFDREEALKELKEEIVKRLRRRTE